MFDAARCKIEIKQQKYHQHQHVNHNILLIKTVSFQLKYFIYMVKSKCKVSEQTGTAYIQSQKWKLSTKSKVSNNNHFTFPMTDCPNNQAVSSHSMHIQLRAPFIMRFFKPVIHLSFRSIHLSWSLNPRVGAGKQVMISF